MRLGSFRVKLALGRVSGRLQKGQKPPAGDHAGAAHRDKGQGHTGQGQDIHRTQHIQGRLEHQHGGGGIGRDDIIAGPGRGGTTGGIEHQYQQNKHRAQGQNQAKLFTDDPKDQVRVGRADVLQEGILPGSLAKRPPLAMADMVRVCWKPPESAACSQTCRQAPKRLAM